MDATVSVVWVKRERKNGVWPAVALPEHSVPRFVAARTPPGRAVLFLGDHVLGVVPESAFLGAGPDGATAAAADAAEAVWEADMICSGSPFSFQDGTHDLWVRLQENRSITFSRGADGASIVVKRAGVGGAQAGDVLLQLADSSFEGTDDVQEAVLALRSAPSPVAVRLRRRVSADASGLASECFGGQTEFVDRRTLMAEPPLECGACGRKVVPHTLPRERRAKMQGTWMCGACMVGRKVKVFWPVDGNWYIADVLEYNERDSTHRLRYPDGDEEFMVTSCQQVIVTAQEVHSLAPSGAGESGAGGERGGLSRRSKRGSRSLDAGSGAAVASPRGGKGTGGERKRSRGPAGGARTRFGPRASSQGSRARRGPTGVQGDRRDAEVSRGGMMEEGEEGEGEEEGEEEEGDDDEAGRGDGEGPLCPVPGFEDEEIHSILAKRTVLVHEGGDAHAVDTQFLVRWEGRPLTDSVWVSLAYLGSDTSGKRKLGQYRKTMRGELQTAEDRREAADGMPFEPELMRPDRVLALRVTDSAALSSSGIPPLLARGAFADFAASAEGVALGQDPAALRRACEKASALGGRELLVKWSTLPYSQAMWSDATAVAGNLCAARDYFLRMAAAATGAPGALACAQRAPLVERELADGESEVARLVAALGEGTPAMLVHRSDEDRFRVGACVLHAQLRATPTRPVIVVCQLATLAQWRDEIAAWGAAEVVSYHGSSKDREILHEREFWREGADLGAAGGAGATASTATIGETAAGAGAATPAAPPPAAAQAAQAPARVVAPCGARPRARFDVMLLTPEMLAIDGAFIKSLDRSLVVVDEAQRLKTATSRAARIVSGLVGAAPALYLLHSGARASPAEALTLLRLIDAGTTAANSDLDTGTRTAPCGPLILRSCPRRAMGARALRGRDWRAESGMSPRGLTVELVDVGEAELEVMRDVVACHASGLKVGDETTRLALTQRVLFRMRELLLAPRSSLSKWAQGRSPLAASKQERTAEVVVAALARSKRVLVVSQSAGCVRELSVLLRGREEVEGGVTQLTRASSSDARLAATEAFRDGSCRVLLQTTRVLGGIYELEDGDALVVSDCGWGYESRLPGLLRSTPPGVGVHLIVARNTLEGELVRRLLCGLRPSSDLADERLAAVYREDPAADANDMALRWSLRFLASAGGAAGATRGGGVAAGGPALLVDMARPLAEQKEVREALFFTSPPPATEDVLSELQESYERLASTLLSDNSSMRDAAVDRLVLAAAHGALDGEAPGSAASWAAMAAQGGTAQFRDLLELGCTRDCPAGEPFRVVQAPVANIRRAEAEAGRRGTRGRRRWTAPAQSASAEPGAANGGAAGADDGAPEEAGARQHPEKRRRGSVDAAARPQRRAAAHTDELVLSWDQVQQLVCQSACFGKLIQRQRTPSAHWLQGAVALTEERMVERASEFQREIGSTLPIKPATPGDAYEDLVLGVSSRAVDVNLTLGANGYAYVNQVLGVAPGTSLVSPQGFRLGDVLLTVNEVALVGLSLRSIMGTVAAQALPLQFRVRRFMDINFYRSERAFAGKPGSRPMISSLSTAPLRRAILPRREGPGLATGPAHAREAVAIAALAETAENGEGGDAYGGEAAFGEDGEDDYETMACNCTKSKCLQRHCSCFKAGRPCTEACRCIGCENCEGKRKFLRCARCATTKTPVWRRGPQGQMLCNACGLLERRRGNVRRSRGKVQRRSTSDFVEVEDEDVAQLELLSHASTYAAAVAAAAEAAPAQESAGIAPPEWLHTAAAVAAASSAQSEGVPGHAVPAIAPVASSSGLPDARAER